VEDAHGAAAVAGVGLPDVLTRRGGHAVGGRAELEPSARSASETAASVLVLAAEANVVE